VTLDECAFFRSDDSAVTDAELMVALRPSLATTNGMMVLMSSPSTMEGMIYKLWERHFGAKGDPRVLVVQSDSKGLNPGLRQETIDQAFAADATAAAAEYGGQFRTPMTAYLERSVVQRCVEAGVTQRVRLPGVQYVGYVDVSGGSGQDSYAACIGHLQRFEGQDVVCIDALFEVKPPLNPYQVTSRLCDELLNPFGITSVTGDDYGSQWQVTAFGRNGVQHHTTPISASEVYLHALPAWTAGRVQMLDNARAVDQLCALKRKVGQAGHEAILHPRNLHDDLANCICGVIWKLTPPAPPVAIVTPIYYSKGNTFPGAVGGGLVAPHLGIPYGPGADARFIGE
jgi:hypothetical protein